MYDPGSMLLPQSQLSYSCREINSSSLLYDSVLVEVIMWNSVCALYAVFFEEQIKAFDLFVGFTFCFYALNEHLIGFCLMTSSDYLQFVCCMLFDKMILLSLKEDVQCY